MTFDHLLDPAPSRKCVLVLNPGTPGIENLRWKQLAARMAPQPLDVERQPHHAAEFRDVPAGFFSSLFASLATEHSAVVAISCLHQTTNEQILVCTKDFFDAELERFSRQIRSTAKALKDQFQELIELTLSLELLAVLSDDEPASV